MDPNFMNSLLPFLVFGVSIAFFYFIMIRPQKRKEQARIQKLNAIQNGDTIVSYGGIVGKVINVKDNDVTIATSVENTQVVIRKAYIAEVETKKD